MIELALLVQWINVLVLVLCFLLGVRKSRSLDRPKLLLATSLMYTILSSCWFQQMYMIFPTCITAFLSLFSWHFAAYHSYRDKLTVKLKEESPIYAVTLSKSWQHFSGKRGYYDPVVYTNIVYLIFGIYSHFYFQQPHLALLQLFTFAASTLYHFSNEINYFNMDQTFAGSLGLIFALSICDSWFLDFEYLLIAVFGVVPLAIFLFEACGMPAEVILLSTCCIRRGRFKYDLLHSIWHIASALGPFMCSYFYQKYFPDPGLVIGRGYFDSYEIFPIVPVTALLLSVGVNFAFNIIGIMPLK